MDRIYSYAVLQSFVPRARLAKCVRIILVPRAARPFLNYVSCSSGNGQKFIYFFGLADSNSMRNSVKLFWLLRITFYFRLCNIDLINFHVKNVAIGQISDQSLLFG